MDPDAALAIARAAASDARELDGQPGSDVDRLEALDRLVEAFEALDGWMSKGGFLPNGWSSARLPYAPLD